MREILSSEEATVLSALNLGQHFGEEKAISMLELYKKTFDEEYNDKINSTRPLRKIIDSLQWKGYPVASINRRNGAGYYILRSGTEIKDRIEREEMRALKILKKNSRLLKLNMPEYVGQIALNLEARHDN